LYNRPAQARGDRPPASLNPQSKNWVRFAHLSPRPMPLLPLPPGVAGQTGFASHNSPSRGRRSPDRHHGRNWVCLYNTPRPASPRPHPPRHRHELALFRIIVSSWVGRPRPTLPRGEIGFVARSGASRRCRAIGPAGPSVAGGKLGLFRTIRNRRIGFVSRSGALRRCRTIGSPCDRGCPYHVAKLGLFCAFAPRPTSLRPHPTRPCRGWWNDRAVEWWGIPPAGNWVCFARFVPRPMPLPPRAAGGRELGSFCTTAYRLLTTAYRLLASFRKHQNHNS
jgi:hypothetical protein